MFNLLSHGLSYMATSTATARLLVKWWETKENFHIRNIIIIYTYCYEIMNEGSQIYYLEWKREGGYPPNMSDIKHSGSLHFLTCH